MLPYKVVIVAGEESGDRHAAEMVLELKSKSQAIDFSGIGGRHMQEAGVELIADLTRFSATGASEILRCLSVIYRAFKLIKSYLIAQKPDLLILVDYPEFNLRLAKFAKKQNIRVLYYISPQIWAWKAGRIKTIKRCVNHMAVILPFEKTLYQNAGVPVTFVGHPLVKDIIVCENTNGTRLALKLPLNRRVIAMLPGSRVNEVERHMPVLVECAKRLLAQHDDLHFVIPIAGTLNTDLIASYLKAVNLPITLIKGHAVEVAACSDLVIVASGTASLECALLEKPMCIIYKVSPLTYFLGSMLIKVQYFGLCNLLKNSMIVPELLQYDCNAHELTKLVNHLLLAPNTLTFMKKNLHDLKQSLSTEYADSTIGELVMRVCMSKKP
jgi:lipid-A-disaccharide synthase